MAAYQDVKEAVIGVVDDFTEDVVEKNYKPKGKKLYGAKTKLISLYINEPMLASMPIRFNKALRQVVGSTWKDIGALDLVAKTTIGELIRLACARSKTTIPSGEPT